MNLKSILFKVGERIFWALVLGRLLGALDVTILIGGR